MSETVKLSTLIPDGRNSNLGTPRGNQMIEDSLLRCDMLTIL